MVPMWPDEENVGAAARPACSMMPMWPDEENVGAAVRQALAHWSAQAAVHVTHVSHSGQDQNQAPAQLNGRWEV